MPDSGRGRTRLASLQQKTVGGEGDQQKDGRKSNSAVTEKWGTPVAHPGRKVEWEKLELKAQMEKNHHMGE